MHKSYVVFLWYFHGFYVQIFSSFVFNRNVSYAQIQIKRSVKTDIKAVKIQSKHFSQFQSCILTVFCICRAIFLVLAHLMKIYSIDYYIWYECSSKKKKGCCSKNTYYKIMTTNKQILSLQIAPPNITSNETQAGMYSVAGLWTLMLLSIIFTSVHEDALFKTFLSQHALWDTDQFLVSRDLIALWRVRVFQME